MDLNKIDENFSGLISIKHNNEIVEQKAFGYADLANRIPNKIDTKFGTASAGKVFVATAILILIEKGYISFNSVIGDILSFDLKQIDPKISIRQLLNHTSGIPDYFDESIMDDYEELWIDYPNYKIRKSSDLIPLFIDKPMMYPRGEKFQYNNTGYVVLDLIIEEITKEPFDTYLDKTIFTPSNMQNTGYFELDRLPANCANSYIFDKERNEYRTNIFSIDAKGTGAGGAFTTATDIENFWYALLNEKLIGKDLLNKMLTSQIEENCYGYGLWLFNENTPYFQGCDPGANFISSYDTKRKLSITILSNMEYNVGELHNELHNELYNFIDTEV